MMRDGEYCSKLIKLINHQARAELEASTIYSRWAHKAPSPEERLHLRRLPRRDRALVRHGQSPGGVKVTPQEVKDYAVRSRRRATPNNLAIYLNYSQILRD
jgi:hypothetical protein